MSIVTLISNVTGNKGGTGSCEAGISSLAGSNHLDATRPGGPRIFADVAMLQINGVPVDPESTTMVPKGVVTWDVVANEIKYKGIFVRVKKMSDDFTLVASDTTSLKDVEMCDTFDGVLGVTHRSSDLKAMSSGTVEFSSAGTATMDVILVFDNTMSSVYAVSSFVLDVVDAPSTPEPAAAPVAAPTPVAIPASTPAPAAVTPSPVDVPIQTSPPVTDSPRTTDPPTTEPPNAEPPETDECSEGKSMEGKMGNGEEGAGRGMGKMSKNGKKCKKLMEPKTPKAGGKQKKSVNDSL